MLRTNSTTKMDTVWAVLPVRPNENMLGDTGEGTPK